jgi:hypothetical protein
MSQSVGHRSFATPSHASTRNIHAAARLIVVQRQGYAAAFGMQHPTEDTTQAGF